jgi:hypothetical protein
MLLALPILIKIFVHLGFFKLNRIPKSMITAEMVIEDINKQKIRPLKVELRYNEVYSHFHDRLKSGEITRERMLAIRRYLEVSVYKYPKKKQYKNDAHMIYSALKAKDITKRNLDIIDQLIGR